jgi:hypothetical protein
LTLFQHPGLTVAGLHPSVYGIPENINTPGGAVGPEYLATELLRNPGVSSGGQFWFSICLK